MAKIRLEVVPWLTRTFGKQELGRVVLEHDVKDGEVLGKVLRDLAEQHKEFGEVAFDKSLKKPSGVVTIGLNNRVVEWAEEWAVHVKDGDTLILMPAYVGGAIPLGDWPYPCLLMMSNVGLGTSGGSADAFRFLKGL